MKQLKKWIKERKQQEFKYFLLGEIQNVDGFDFLLIKMY